MQFKSGPVGGICRRAAVRRGSHMEAAAGQSMVEFALVLPVLLLLLFGVVDLGWMAYLKVVVSNAARAGVQYGSQDQGTAADNSGMTAAALKDAPNISSLTVTSTRFCECSDNPGTAVACSPCAYPSRLIVFVRVNTSAPYQAWLPYPGLTQTATISGSSTMRVLQ